MKQIDPKKKIILDADVIIHFCKGNSIGILPRIFPNIMYVPDIVFEEALSHAFKTEITNLLRFKLIKELEIKAELDVYKEYSRLQKTGLGKGESACLAYCRYHNDVVGSSNLKDIHRYCDEHGIVYLTTMDFLAEALRKGILNETECDFFIYNVKSKKSKLPVDRINEYLEKHM